MDGATPAHRFADVSAILPLYNGRRHLLDAVRSIAGQSLLPRELIVVDDGSGDDGASLLDELAAPFPIMVVKQPNAGQSAARNHGARLSTQPYLAFLDQDDLWLPEHLTVLMAGIARNRLISWVYGDFDEIDGQGRTVTKRFLREHAIPNPKTSLVACVSRDLMVIPSASLLRREVFVEVGGFDEELSGYEDDELFIRMFRAGYDHHYVDRTVTRFRIHTGSSSEDGRFIASRLVFGRKLRETIEDDRRFHRYYYRDVIVPRLFQQSLDDYVRFASAQHWSRALAARDAMNAFGAEHPGYRRKQWKLKLIQDPARLRRALQLQDHLPLGITIFRNPAMRFRP